MNRKPPLAAEESKSCAGGKAGGIMTRIGRAMPSACSGYSCPAPRSRSAVDEVAAKRVVFTLVNNGLPENAHFLQDYKLPCPSLVLVCVKDAEVENGSC
jgi:hypothetical protein